MYTSDMTLDKYRDKRQFDDTPEPSGLTETKPQNRFVVQEHFASHHHFDFRLELPEDFLTTGNPNGPIVLKSWAIPKGISDEKGVKRLAILVEDHPVDYISFEGTIPEGHYGAGTVSIWDEGAFEIIHTKTDNLKFTLHGKRLSGNFHLIHTKRGKGNEWLIFK